MITEKDIIKAYKRIRTIDNTIPDEVLDFIKEASIKQLRIGGVGSSMVKLCGNTTNKDYAGFTDQMIAVSKNGQTIILEPEDLKKLEQVVGGKFRR